MKHQNITFSIPDDLKSCLFARVGNRGRSRFISDAIRKALKEEESTMEQELDAAYESASLDSDRIEILRDWDALDNVGDLIDDDENWDWLKMKKGKN